MKHPKSKFPIRLPRPVYYLPHSSDSSKNGAKHWDNIGNADESKIDDLIDPHTDDDDDDNDDFEVALPF